MLKSRLEIGYAWRTTVTRSDVLSDRFSTPRNALPALLNHNNLLDISQPPKCPPTRATAPKAIRAFPPLPLQPQIQPTTMGPQNAREAGEPSNSLH